MQSSDSGEAIWYMHGLQVRVIGADLKCKCKKAISCRKFNFTNIIDI